MVLMEDDDDELLLEMMSFRSAGCDAAFAKSSVTNNRESRSIII